MKIALDIETRSTTPDPDHALIPHLAEITVVGAYWLDSQGRSQSRVFRDLAKLQDFLFEEYPHAVFVGHNFKFDLKHLASKGIELPAKRWADDTILMATASYEKIPQDWLDEYERQRLLLPRGHGQRKAGRHSLKTLAPYYLKVDPFWEVDGHDDDEYVIKDCRYTYELGEKLVHVLNKQGMYEFYRDKLMPWGRMFLEAEKKGITLDLGRMNQLQAETEEELEKIKTALDEKWGPATKARNEQAVAATKRRYKEMTDAALARLKNPNQEQIAKTQERYKGLAEAAVEKVAVSLNPDSPADMLWLFRDYLQLDCEDFNGKEGTGREVLERLTMAGSDHAKLLSEYREKKKLISSFFNSYNELRRGNVLHCDFNLSTTRTGRTSSRNPNLQQVKGDIHEIFVARPGYELVTKDLSAIEPRLIAYYSEDETLCKLMISGDDFHGYCTNLIFGENWDLTTLKTEHPKERRFVKTIDLAVFYGSGANRVRKVSFDNGFDFSLARAKRAVNALRGGWPGVVEFKKHLDNLATQHPIRNFFDRKRAFVDHDEIYMKNFNGLIQSSASDLLLTAALNCTRRFKREGLDAYPLLWVHDELVVEASESCAAQAEAIMEEEMTAFKLTTQWGDIPLQVEGSRGKTWSK